MELGSRHVDSCVINKVSSTVQGYSRNRNHSVIKDSKYSGLLRRVQWYLVIVS